MLENRTENQPQGFFTEPAESNGRFFPWLLAALVFVGAFGVLTYLVHTHATEAVDLRITNYVVAHRTPPMNTLAHAVTLLGNWEAIVILCLLGLAMDKTRFTLGVPLTVAATITSVVKAVVKVSLQRPRPSEVLHLIVQGGYSFPSGHAITSIAVYLLLAVLLIRLARKNGQGMAGSEKAAEQVAPGTPVRVVIGIGVSFFLAFAVGLSRVYLGVHYASDVLAGWCFGLATFLVIYGWIVTGGYDHFIDEKILAKRPKAGSNE